MKSYYLGGLIGEAFATSLHLLSVFTPAPPSSISFWAFPAFSTPGKSVQRLNNVSPVNESSPLSYEQPTSPLSPSSKSPGLSTELQSRTKVVVKVAHLNTIIGPFQTPYIDVQQRLFVLFLNVPRPPYSMLGHFKNNYARSMAEGK